MAVSRYSRDPLILNRTTLRTASAFRMVRQAVNAGRLTNTVIVLQGLGRLDELAGKYYGDGRYWWIIAAASNIGWGLQVPGGTNIVIPNLGQVLDIIE